jgi:hypothetical protein
MTPQRRQSEERGRGGEDMSYKFRQWFIPERMMGGITRYIEQGIPPGDFLNAIIDNNLSEAVSRADDENMANLPAYVAYFYNEAPSPCWGSPERRKAWLAAKQTEREAKAAV